MELRDRLESLPGEKDSAPRDGDEYVAGWGVFALPFSSGHVLALRVFPQSTFGSYVALWHRDPMGGWAIYVDGARLDEACPRYFGPACDHTALASIDVTWTGPASLHVTMAEPGLDWTLTARSTRLLDVLNAVGGRLPAATWRPRALRRAREVIAHRLGMGRIELDGVMPSGHHGRLMPHRMYLVDRSEAILEGVGLGRPVSLADNPAIGDFPLPARGVLVEGGAVWERLDPVDASPAGRP